jgi:hypothetical protein
MPDDFNLDDVDLDDNDEQDEATLVKRLRGVIREQKKREKQMQADIDANAAATKKLAFIEAKLPDEPQVKFFLDHYEGDYTPEAIREAAATNGFIVLNRETEDEVGQLGNMSDASSGSTPASSPGSDKELMEKINAVKPGQNASKQIRDIMASAGRYQSDE